MVSCAGAGLLGDELPLSITSIGTLFFKTVEASKRTFKIQVGKPAKVVSRRGVAQYIGWR